MLNVLSSKDLMIVVQREYSQTANQKRTIHRTINIHRETVHRWHIGHAGLTGLKLNDPVGHPPLWNHSMIPGGSGIRLEAPHRRNAHAMEAKQQTHYSEALPSAVFAVLDSVMPALSE